MPADVLTKDTACASQRQLERKSALFCVRTTLHIHSNVSHLLYENRFLVDCGALTLSLAVCMCCDGRSAGGPTGVVLLQLRLTGGVGEVSWKCRTFQRYPRCI